MSDQNIQGVDLAVGKLSLPISLVSVSGPNNFGETLTLQYATLGLLNQIRTWNEETTTDVLGLGWSLSEEHIIRVGDGSLDDQFMWNQGSSQPLVLKAKTLDANTGIYTLEFVTATQSLNKITYQTIPNNVNSPEIWTIVDPNGVTYTYGGNQAAIDWGVRWVATDGESPLSWIGTSISTTNQTNYALMWHLASKENIYGQRVEYDYFSVKYNVGENGAGLNYTMASYLQAIRVVDGSSVTLNYADKNTWESSAMRMLSPSSSGSGVSNAYQDRLVTKYLQSVNVYNAQGNLQSIVALDYDFLFMHYPGLSANTSLPTMQKRVLTSISYLTPDGKNSAPAQLFDYWGLDGSAENYTKAFTISATNLMILTGADLAGTYTYASNHQKSHEYGALYGHLKTVTSSQGAVSWYSYREVSANYQMVSWPTSWSENWKNQLDFADIPWPAGGTASWRNPRPFWGPDNYVVVVWDGVETGNVPGSNCQIAIKIFEWMGLWVESRVTQGSSEVGLTFAVDESFRKQSAECIKFGMGSGKFAFCRLGLTEKDNNMGLITLFNRDPYLPGVWNIASKLNDGTSTNTFKIIPPNSSDLEWSYQQLEVSVGTHVAAILDKVGSKLYLYSLVDNRWVSYDDNGIQFVKDPQYGYDPAALGSIVDNDDVFIMASVGFRGQQGYNHQTFYWLYHFDITQPASSAWQILGQQHWDPVFSLGANSVCSGMSISPMGGGVFMAQGLVSDNATFPTYYSFPVAISWNIPTSDVLTWQVNLQCIKSYTIWNGKPQYDWGVPIEATAIFGNKAYGSMMSSNLINILPNGGSGDVNTRYIARYAGGSDSSYEGENAGWVGDYNFNMLKDNSDQWCQLATLDTTVEVNTTNSTHYGYNFYQFTPYGNSGNAEHPFWFSQPEVSKAMGQNTDWQAIMATVNETLMCVSVFFQGISMCLFFPGLAVAESIAAISTLLKWAVRAYEFADFMINTVGGLSAQFILAPMAKRALAGRSEGSDTGMKYLIVGQGSVTADPDTLAPPRAFAKVWDSKKQCWAWQTIANFPLAMINSNASNNVPWPWKIYESSIDTFLGRDLYSYGNNFIPFSYVAYGHRKWENSFRDQYFRGFYFDQVAFFQNAQCLAVDLMPMFSTGPLTSNGYKILSASLPYLFYNYTDKQPSPVMCAAWGGILGYQPIVGINYDPGVATTTNWAWESASTGFPDAIHPSESVRPTLATAQGLLLTLARDGLLQGPVTDYVVDQVAVDDGYQLYNTFFQYMPENAVYQPIESAVYNQVRVAQGGTDYTSSATANGWSEYYFYNGSVNYPGTRIAGASALPYDPAAGNDAVSSVNQAYTNVSQYYGLMSGKLYCQRTLKSQNGKADFSTGYEVARQQIFYQGFENYLGYDSSGTPTTQQKVVGVLPTLTVSYSAPANANSPQITAAYTAGDATLQSTYYFYDMTYTDRNNQAQSLSAPWTPADPTTLYQLGLNSGLPLGKLQFNYHQTSVKSDLAIEGVYTQVIPGVYVPQLESMALTYQQFTNLNLYNATVQTIKWYHPNLTAATDSGSTLNFATPMTAWSNANGQDWQIVSSKVTAWQIAKDSQNNAVCWYPAGTYVWQGDPNGHPVTAPLTDTSAFPWAMPPLNATNTEWLQQGSAPSFVTASGILLAAETTTTLPTYTVYDQKLRWPLMKVTNAALPGTSMAFYTGFEVYEDMSAWSYGDDMNSNMVLTFSPYSYAGNRSVMIAADGNAYHALSLSLPNVAPNQNTWLLAANVLVQTTSKNITLTLSVVAGYQSSHTANLYDKSFTPSDSWVSYSMPIDVSAFPIITDLTFFITASAPANIYIDSLYCMPACEAQFSCLSYDLATLSPIASASPQDPAFCSRVLTDNRGRTIGAVRKATQSSGAQWLGQPDVAVKMGLKAAYFSRDGIQNNDAFSATDPNLALRIVAGANQSLAGYYFDFRDGLNPWTGGSVLNNTRALLLDKTQSASYAIPTNLNWGVGIRAQIQGYIEPVSPIALSTNSAVSTPQAVALPTPAVSDCFHLYGAYSNGAHPTDIYAFDLSFNTALPAGTQAPNESTSVSISNSTAVTSNQQLLTCNSAGNLLFGVFESNNQYSLYNFSATTNVEIYTTSDTLYPPMAGNNDIVYFADEGKALYGVDVSNCTNQPALGFNPTQVVTYNDIVANATCPMAPVMDATHTSMAWFIKSTSPNPASSQALEFVLNQNGFGQVVDQANVLNFDYDQDFTIECWVSCASINKALGYNYIIAKWTDNQGVGPLEPYPYIIRMDSDGHVHGVRYDNAQNNPDIISTTAISDGKFHHIAFVRQTDETGLGKLYLYIDGLLEDTQIDTTTVSTQNDANVMLNNQFFGSDQIKGNQMMELRVWNHARTFTQINVNMQRQLTGYEGGLVGYWPLNGKANDLSPVKQDMALSNAGCQYVPLASTDALPAPASAWVKYDTASNSISAWVVSDANNPSTNVVTLPAISADGAMFGATPTNVYAYDTQLGYLGGAPIGGTLADQLAVGNQRVLVATTAGLVTIYDESLNWIMAVKTGLTLSAPPVVHGDKFSVVGQLNSVWTIQTYTMTGILVTQPYVVNNVQTSVSIQAFSPNLSSLCVMVDNTTFRRLDFGVPIGTSMSLGNYTVLYTQDNGANYQYQLQNNGTGVASFNMGTLNEAIGDWWLMVVENILYFYADSAQIFAYAIADTTLPTGDFMLSAGESGISCRDIVVCLEPTPMMQFTDGAGKVRQTQTLATIAAPQ
jgi:hypothetical protein